MMILILLLSPACASGPWQAEAALSFFQQKEQVRAASGSTPGPLFEQWAIAPRIAVSRELDETFSVGPFASFELGRHLECAYAASASRAGCQTSRYHQYFVGPFGRVRWKSLFVDLSYIALGIRSDTRSPAIAGSSTSELFWTHPLKAWLIHPGISAELSEDVSVSLRLEYRYLYFNRSSAGTLPQSVLFGTQSLRPLIGVQARI